MPGLDWRNQKETWLPNEMFFYLFIFIKQMYSYFRLQLLKLRKIQINADGVRTVQQKKEKNYSL